MQLAVQYDSPGIASPPTPQGEVAARQSAIAQRVSMSGQTRSSASSTSNSMQADASGLTIVTALAKMEPKGTSTTSNHHGEYALHALCQRKALSPETVAAVVGAYPAAASVADRVSALYLCCACCVVGRSRAMLTPWPCDTPARHAAVDAAGDAVPRGEADQARPEAHSRVSRGSRQACAGCWLLATHGARGRHNAKAAAVGVDIAVALVVEAGCRHERRGTVALFRCPHSSTCLTVPPLPHRSTVTCQYTWRSGTAQCRPKSSINWWTAAPGW